MPPPQAIKAMVNSWEAAQVISTSLATDQHKVRGVAVTTTKEKPEYISTAKSASRLTCWTCGGNHLKRLCTMDPGKLMCKKCNKGGHSTAAHNAKIVYINQLTDQEESSSDEEAILESKARKISSKLSRGRQSNETKTQNKRKSR